jgi:hypothetical protein
MAALCRLPDQRAAVDPPMSEMSEQLRDTLVAYCLYMEPGSLEDLTADIEQGGLAWFPQEFSQALVAGIFTPDLWGRLTQTGLDEDDQDQLDADLRAVWAHAAPGRPFPLDR